MPVADAAEVPGALIAAGRDLFTERGFAGAGREEIVERAGLTRGALYHHFTSKEDLFAAVYEEVERELTEAVVVAAAASTDPVDGLRLGAFAFLAAAATPEVRRIVLLAALHEAATSIADGADVDGMRAVVESLLQAITV